MVGILHSETGPMAVSERSMIDAEVLALEEINRSGGLGGTVVLVFPTDPGTRPWVATVAVALRSEQLPESEPPTLDGYQAVRVLVGPTSTSA